MIRGRTLAMPCHLSVPLRNEGVEADADLRLYNVKYSLVLLSVPFLCGQREPRLQHRSHLSFASKMQSGERRACGAPKHKYTLIFISVVLELCGGDRMNVYK